MHTKHLLLVISLCFCLPLLGCKKSGESTSGDRPASAKGVATPKGPVTLKLKNVPGSRTVQRMEMKQNSETIIPQMPQPMKQDTTMGQEFAVSVLKEREGGGCELEMEFLATQMTVSMGDRTLVNFDSAGETADDGNNPIANTFRKMVGARIKFFLDASNKVDKVEGVEDFRKRLSSGAPKEVLGILNSMFTDDYFKQMVNFGQGLPPGPVNIGDSWPVQLEITMGPLGAMALDLQYTFKGWETREKRNCAVLEYEGTMKTKPGRGASPMGMTMSIEDGKSKGKSWFDPEAGMFVDSDIKQDMTLLMTLPNMVGGQTNASPQTQTMTNRMSQNITVKVVESTGGAK